ncbi:hypothetical protein [Paraburkholderia phosphatilytica]|uniref:hypothetical protein n=1 Tax=Paraburkholderia phosphatilytica TaxID=2282883 RepID=UPI000E54F65A|nr:hypothetical protein [Paraburkholderia phosphatilytica]
MYRLSALAAGLLLASSAFAGQPAAAQTAAPVLVASAPAAADRVYPPLPTLSMIPVATSDEEEDEPPARPATSSRKKKGRVVAERRPTAPMARLVVSDDSRVYLHSVERQIDQALLLAREHEPVAATASR